MRRNIVAMLVGTWLWNIGKATRGAGLLGLLGMAIHFGAILIGVPLVSIRLDKKRAHEECKISYSFLMAYGE